MRTAMPRTQKKSVTLTQLLWHLWPHALLCLTFAAVGVLHVGARVLVVDSAYTLSELQKETKQHIEKQKELRVELATAKSPAKLEARAREQLGMGPPAPSAVLSIGGNMPRLGRAAPTTDKRAVQASYRPGATR
jgi:cell division protein FtsL